MQEKLSDILKRIANPFIFGNIFIALCTLSLFLETYLQLGLPVKLDGLAYLVFFATLFLYNFHRLMGVRRILPEDRGIITGWAAKHQFTILMLTLIGAGGIGIFVFWEISMKIFILLVILGSISLLYELPVVRYHHTFQRLRNLWIHKAFMITTVWGLTTALLPAINSGMLLTDYHVWLVTAERMIFIFLLALCFDARDVEFDKKDNLKTIPMLYGMKKTNDLYRIASVLFFVVASIHYFLLNHYWGIGIAMAVSIGITYISVEKSYPRKSDYYYMFVADGMMIVQFLLAFILASFK